MFKIALTAPHKTTLLLHPGLLTSLFTFFMYCVSPDNNRLLPGAALVWIVCLHRYRTCAWLLVLKSTIVKALVRAQNPQGRWKGYPATCGTVTIIWSFFFFSSKASFQLWYSWDFCFRLHCPPDYRLPEPALPPIPGSAYSSLCYTEQFGSLQLHERAHENKVFFYFWIQFLLNSHHF